MIEFNGDVPSVETAQYIQDMAKELEALASRAGLGFLAYLLAMVEQEAGRGAHADAATRGA